MKSQTVVLAALIVVGLLVPGMGAKLPSLPAQAPENPGTISVSGNAQVRVVPNEVVMTLGIETSNKDLAAARQQNDQIIRRVTELTRKYGIASQNVQTDYLNIEPRYDSAYSRQESFIGYFVARTVVITLKDLSKFDNFYADVLGTGVNYVQGIQFRTTDLRKYRDQARSLAIQAAREKATAMAAELGMQLGEVRAIQENSGNWWSGYSSWWGGRWGGGMAQNVIQNVGGSSGLPQDSTLAPGQIEVDADVSVTFTLVHKAP